MKNNLLPQNAIRIDLSNNNKKILIFLCSVKNCTNEIRVPPSKIRNYSGKCASCVSRKKPFGVCYKRLLSNCKIKFITNTITYEQFVNFTKIKNCEYCDSKIEWTEYTSADHGSVAYNLDRKDALKGYSEDNCVVCCKICNWSKNDLFSHEEFLQIGKAIRKVLRKREGLGDNEGASIYDCG